jgi:DNA repair exonuclease SbcCD ATPase subunit
LKFQTLQLRNVGPHRELDLDLNPNVNFIMGRNGTGKSTILQALEYGLVGDPAVFVGAKEDNVHQLAAKGDPAYVRIAVEHGGSVLEITRHLRSSRAEVSRNGGKEETGAGRVNAVVAESLNVPLSIISGYVFTKQRKIYDFLMERPAERAATFQTLFGTEHAARVFKLADDEAKTIPKVQVTDELEDLRVKLAELDVRLQGVDDQLAQVPEVEPVVHNRFMRAISAVGLRKADVHQVIANRRRARALGVELGAIQARIDEATEAVALFREVLAEAREGSLEAWRTLGQWGDYRTYTGQHRRLADRIAAHEARIAANPPPTPLTGAELEQLEQFDASRDHLSAEIHRLTLFVHSFDGGVATCPTCGTAVENLGESLDSARAELPRLKAIFDSGYALCRKASILDLDLASHAKWLAEQTAGVASLREQLAALKVVERPSRTEDELLAVTREHDEFQTQLEHAQSDLVALVTRRKLLEEERAGAVFHAADALDKLCDPRPSRELYAEAQQYRRDQVRLSGRRGELRGQRAELERQRATYQARLARVEKVVREAAITEAWRAQVERIKARVHRDALPTQVSMSYLRKIEALLNEQLANFRSRFSVESSKDLSFTARYADGRVMPAIRLSPGEKVVLALAFRVVVNRLFANELGIFALDEPTDSLDSENLACVQGALESLKGISHSQGLQVFVISHDRRLASHSDQIIDLGGW